MAVNERGPVAQRPQTIDSAPSHIGRPPIMAAGEPLGDREFAWASQAGATVGDEPIIDIGDRQGRVDVSLPHAGTTGCSNQ